MASVLTFYSDDTSSDPAEVYSFSVKFVLEKNKNKQKEAGVGPFLKNNENPGTFLVEFSTDPNFLCRIGRTT